MRARNKLWRWAFPLSALFLVLPLWMRSGRADPLFLLPVMGLIALACVGPKSGWRQTIVRASRLIAISVLAASMAVWAASGTLPLTQILIVVFAALPLTMLHQLVARDGRVLRRAALHAVFAIAWFPAGIVLANMAYQWPEPEARPRVTLLSSMPLAWGAATGDFGALLSIDAQPAPIYSLLQRSVALQPADMVTPHQLQSTDVLLLIQPPSLPPAALVAIDDWVRKGGRVLWLADPSLAPRGDFPFGDPRNPVAAEANTALLNSWGLQLSAPAIVNTDSVTVNDRGVPLSLSSPGRLAAFGEGCQLRAGLMIAECRIGSGRALILADADMVQGDYWLHAPDGHGSSAFEWTSGNGQWLVATLRWLGSLRDSHSLTQPTWLRPSLRR